METDFSFTRIDHMTIIKGLFLIKMLISFVRLDRSVKNVFYRDGSEGALLPQIAEIYDHEGMRDNIFVSDKCKDRISPSRPDMDVQSEDVLYTGNENIDSIFIDSGDSMKDFVRSVVIPFVVARGRPITVVV
jgi:hypothetical protein